MIVYKFLNKEYGLQALRHLRIKASTLNDLNDPFELLSANQSGEKQRRGFRILKQVYNENIGLLCFSKSYGNPVLWSHYADKHKGVALEIAVFDGFAHDVRYVKTRSKIDFSQMLNLSNDEKKRKIHKILTTKYQPWEYEDEARAILPKDDFILENNLHFISLDTGNSISIKSDMLLTGIVLGLLCDITYKEIEETLPPSVSIDVTKTRLAFNSFKVVKNMLYKTKRIDGKS